MAVLPISVVQPVTHHIRGVLCMPSTIAESAVLLFGDRSTPRPLRGLPEADRDDVDGAVSAYRRLIVVGTDADLATVLTRLLRIDHLDTELAFVAKRRSPATRAYGLVPGYRG